MQSTAEVSLPTLFAQAETLPTPTGYRLLIRMREVPERTAGGIVRPTDTKKVEEAAQLVAQVVAAGPDAYNDMERFPSGPWCRVGDWVMIRAYSGTRYKVGDVEYRFINDDAIEGVTTAPESIGRV